MLDLLEDLVETPPSARDDILTGGAGCGDEDGPIARRRADAAWVGDDDGTPIVVMVEVDENGGHPDRHPSCEAAKITGTFRAHQQLLTRCKSATRSVSTRSSTTARGQLAATRSKHGSRLSQPA